LPGLNLRIATVIISGFSTRGAPLSTFQQQVLEGIVKDTFLEVYGLKHNDRCERCYSNVNVGRVVTISPNANFSNMFPVCMKNIFELEAWIRGQTKGKTPVEGELGSQQTL
jgi:hypothetical protein